MLDLVKLGGLGGRKPHQISGGQRQRVALARALARAPKLLLLDEPLAALDKKLREHTQFELAGIQYRTGVTFVVVTHDQEEAMTLANRIAVMDRGRIRQVGTPTEIYEYPKTRFVADFIGSINMLEGRVVARRRRARPRRPARDRHRRGPRHPRPGARAGDHPGAPPREDRHQPRAPDASPTPSRASSRTSATSARTRSTASASPRAASSRSSSTNARRVGENERVAQWEDRVWLAFDPSAAILLPEERDA